MITVRRSLTQDRLTLITLNTQLLPMPTVVPGNLSRLMPAWLLERADERRGRHRAARQDTDQERRADGLARLIIAQRPDIVCLQEVFDRPGRRRLIQWLSPYLPFIAEPRGKSTTPGNSGLMTLSRFPFASEPLSYAWKASAGTDALAAKGAMICTLDLGRFPNLADHSQLARLVGRSLSQPMPEVRKPYRAVIANVHLQAGKPNSDIRRAQLIELRAALRAALHDEVALDRPDCRLVAIGGDCNMADPEGRDSLRAAFASSVADMALVRDPHPPTTNADGRIDYWLLHSASFGFHPESIDEVSVLDTRGAGWSDHDGVVARLNLEVVRPVPFPSGAARVRRLKRVTPRTRAMIATATGVPFAALLPTTKIEHLPLIVMPHGAQGGTKSVAAGTLADAVRRVGDGIEFGGSFLLGYVDNAVEYLEPTEIALMAKGRPRSGDEAAEDAKRFVRDATVQGPRAPLARRLKAVGGHHAMSDVIEADALYGTRRDMRWFRRVEYRSDKSDMCRFAGGARIDDLNHALGAHDPHVARGALKNQPGYGGLTFVGTMSVGGHGAGAAFGPLAEHVRALRVHGFDANGECTDRRLAWPDTPLPPDVKLASDNSPDLMKAALVGLGLVGIITEVIIDVQPDGFRIAEVRERDKWRSLRHRLDDLVRWCMGSDKSSKPPVPDGVPHSFELWINPYDLDDVVIGKRWTTQEPVSGKRQRVLRDTATVFASERLLERWKRTGRLRLDEAREAQRTALAAVVRPEPVVMSAAEGLSFGAPNTTDPIALSVAVRWGTLAGAIERIHQLAVQMAEDDAATPYGRILASPIGVRAVRACANDRRPFLSPQFEQPDQLERVTDGITAMIELPTMRAFIGAEETLTRLCRTLVQDFAARPHWGQFLPESLPKANQMSYRSADVDGFIKARKDLDPQQVFSNAFSARFGLDF
ncbi:MAG: endonuclease/exonuclease/phosphatase family protein [Myxococcota bacterium]